MKDNDWSDYSNKSLRHPKNPEFVTGRVNIVNNRKVIRISIGKVICSLIKFKRGDRVTVQVHKNDKHLLLIEKCDGYHSYALTESVLNNKKSNFLCVSFRYDFNEPFRLSQTIVLDYDINENELLLIDLLKLKWRE